MSTMQEVDTKFFVTCINSTRNTSRCWGWYNTFESAERAVLENHTDIYEYFYDHAVIEEVPEGVCPVHTKEAAWYRWSNRAAAYERCDKPEFSEGIVCWGIG